MHITQPLSKRKVSEPSIESCLRRVRRSRAKPLACSGPPQPSQATQVATAAAAVPLMAGQPAGCSTCSA